MRVLYSHYLTNEQHPATRMVHTIAAELREFGHEVTVHRSEGPVPVPVVGATTTARRSRFEWLRKQLWFAKAIARNRKLIERDRAVLDQARPEVVLCRNDAYCTSMPKACVERGIPYVIYSDAPAAFEARRFNTAGRWHPPLVLERLEKQVLSRSRGIVTVSHPAKAILERYRTGIPIAVAHNGVDAQEYQPLSVVAKRTVREREGARRPLIAGFVGTFRAFHGAELLEQIIRATTIRADLEWWLIGDGPCRADLERKLRTYPQVRFFGSRPAAAVPELLAALDVSLIPHAWMGDEFYFCPLKILESLACGVPCVASRQGDIPELLDSTEPGEVLETLESSEWVMALNRLLDDAPRRLKLGQAMRVKAQDCYSWANTARVVEAVLQAAPGRHRPHTDSVLDLDDSVSGLHHAPAR